MALEASEPESEFTTGPVAPTPIDRRPVRGTTLGGELIGERQRRLKAEAAEVPDEDEDEDEDEDAVDEDESENESDEDEDEDEELDAQEDALFNLACAAVEQGEALSWQETASLLLTAEVLDPRLALLVGLLMEGAPEDSDEGEPGLSHTPLPLTGERVLRVLGELGLEDLVEEAREVTELAPDERELVRTNARALNDLSKRELGDGAKGQKGQKASQGAGRPLRASDIKAKRSSLSSGAAAAALNGPRRNG